MKRTSVLALAVISLVVCGFPIVAHAAAAAAAPGSIAREVAGGFPCPANGIHHIDLRVNKAAKTVQVDAASKAVSVRIGDCVSWRAVVTDGSGKAAVAAVQFLAQPATKTRAAEKWADVCDYSTSGEQCLVGIGFRVGEVSYTAAVSHGGIRKTSDTLKIIIVPCLPPACKPNPLEQLVAIREAWATVHR